MKIQNPMRNINPFGLRLQPELKSVLEDAAEKNKRSLNAEIVARLEASVEPESGELSMNYLATLTDLMGKVEEHLASLDAKGGPDAAHKK